MRQARNTYLELEVVVYGTYSPKEKETRDYPGCGDDFEVERVILQGRSGKIDLMSFLEEYQVEELVERCLEIIHDEQGKAYDREHDERD